MSGELSAVGAGEAMAGPSSLTELEAFRDEFVQIFRDMGQMTRVALEPICVRHDMTQQQVLLLLGLWANPGVSMGRACEDLGMLRTNFTQLVHKMEGRGLVARTQDARDRRSYALDLTEEGRALVASMQDEFARQNAHVAEAMTPQVREDLGRGLRAVKEIVASMEAGALYPRR